MRTVLPVDRWMYDPSGFFLITNAVPFEGKENVFPLLPFVNINARRSRR